VVEAPYNGMGSSFLGCRKFSKFSDIVLLNIFTIHLAYTSFPSMPKIFRVGLLIDSQSSCIFL
jgi:hypothetical protein